MLGQNEAGTETFARVIIKYVTIPNGFKFSILNLEIVSNKEEKVFVFESLSDYKNSFKF